MHALRVIAKCACISCCFLIPLVGTPREWQAGSDHKSSFVGASERYERTLDLLFPREVDNPKKHLRSRIVLRFRPSFAPESQIVISRYADGGAEVMLFSLPAERGSVADHINELVERDIEDPTEIARQIKVERKRVDLDSSVIDALLQRYSDLRVAPSLDTQITLDPTFYELWFETGSNRFHLSLAGPDYSYAPKADPVIRWMNDVRLAAQGRH